MAPRVFVCGFHHEGNSFSTLLTRRENFAVVEGVALLEKARTSSASLGGAVRLLDEKGARVVAGVSAVAPPGGPIEDATFHHFRDRILSDIAAAKPDAIYLDLHGGMVTESLEDAEGALLAALRAAVGPSMPVAVSLDLHAHLTPAMLGAVEICVACKENPHSDYDAAGARAAELLLDALAGRLRPVTAASFLPMTVAAQMETARGPLKRLHDARRALMARHPRLLDISLYNTTALVDAAACGQAVSAITDGDAALARETAEALARALWEARHDFVSDREALDVVLARARASPASARPFVLGDQGDRVLAGTPGDDTLILRTVLEAWPDLRALVPVTDPAAVAAARAAGAGAEVDIAVGGALSKGGVPVRRRWRVLRLGDGAFVQHGPYLAGEPSSLGPTALLAHANATVLAMTYPGYTQDPHAFSSQGADLRDFDLVVAKSGFHFKLSFAGIGTAIVADTPGVSNYRPGLLPYRRRRPCWPEDDIPAPDFTPSLFAPRSIPTRGTP
ncbi:MAG: M81 family metallopeptidase [Alphaproteobacteria bacterium]|nr:M81 family metallopeptidase [Alphaproteobacteria bacterium]